MYCGHKPSNPFQSGLAASQKMQMASGSHYAQLNLRKKPTELTALSNLILYLVSFRIGGDHQHHVTPL